MEKHIDAKHTAKLCVYCDKEFNSEEALLKHHKSCTKNIGLANSICDQCNNKFTEQGLKRHHKVCQAYNTKFDCPECGQMFVSSNAVTKHQDDEHNYEPVRSRIVCKHWRRGKCFKGDRCGFSHVGRQIINESQDRNITTTKVPACTNGPHCEWLAKGNCSYFHPRVGVQKPWTRRHDQDQSRRQEPRSRQEPRTRQESRTRQEPRSSTRQDRETCKFDGRCDRIPNCPYMHYQEDFPPFQGRRNQEVRRHQNQRRN